MKSNSIFDNHSVNGPGRIPDVTVIETDRFLKDDYLTKWFLNLLLVKNPKVPVLLITDHPDMNDRIIGLGHQLWVMPTGVVDYYFIYTFASGISKTNGLLVILDQVNDTDCHDWTPIIDGGGHILALSKDHPLSDMTDVTFVSYSAIPHPAKEVLVSFGSQQKPYETTLDDAMMSQLRIQFHPSNINYNSS